MITFTTPAAPKVIIEQKNNIIQYVYSPQLTDMGWVEYTPNSMYFTIYKDNEVIEQKNIDDAKYLEKTIYTLNTEPIEGATYYIGYGFKWTILDNIESWWTGWTNSIVYTEIIENSLPIKISINGQSFKNCSNIQISVNGANFKSLTAAALKVLKS